MEQNAKKKISCGGFMLGEGLVLSEDGKTLSVSGGGGGSGSADAVLYTAQTLTDAQKKQARDNIGAAIADFVVNGTMGSDGTVTLNKTFAQIQAAVQDGKRPVLKLSVSGVAPTFIPLVSADTTAAVFTALTDVSNEGITSVSVIINPAGDVSFIIAVSPASNSDGTMPQFPMASDPTSPMQIATKKYVDDKECVLKSSTPGSTKKFRITVDDSGTLKATEI